MNKWIILFIVIALSFISQAALVLDGDFASGTMSIPTASHTYIADTGSYIDAGWFNYPTTSPWSISGGALTRSFASGGNGGRSIGQLISASLVAGNYTFDFDYTWLSTDTAGDIWVQLYLYDNPSGSATLAYNDRMDLTGATEFTTPSGANFTISELATSGNLIAAQTAGTTAHIAFNLASSMGTGDLLGIRIGTLNAGGQTDATLTFDNIGISPVPEPATAGIFILGSLGVWITRRSLKKSKELADA